MYQEATQPLVARGPREHSPYFYILIMFFIVVFVHLDHSKEEERVGTNGTEMMTPENSEPPGRGKQPITQSEAGPSGIPPANSVAVNIPNLEVSEIENKHKLKGVVLLLINSNKEACASVEAEICRRIGRIVDSVDKSAVTKFCKFDPEGACADTTGAKLMEAKKVGKEMPEKVMFEILLADERSAENVGTTIQIEQFRASFSKFIRTDVEFSYIVPSKCNDPVHGFEARVGSCGQFYHNSRQTPDYDAVLLTSNEWQIVYLVKDTHATCEDSVCSDRDTETCCKVPARCHTAFLKDVPSGCPADKVLNPFKAAFCRTYPCSQADSDICCISDPGALYVMTNFWRSKYARVTPDMQAEVAIPHISFARGDVAWFDMSKKVTIGEEEWAPLVNFMKDWGAPGKVVGWKTEAWMQISQRGNAFYKPAEIDKVLPKTYLIPWLREKIVPQH